MKYILSALVLTALVFSAQAQELKTNPRNTVAVDAKKWPHSTADKHFHLWVPEDTLVLKGLLVFVFHGGEQHFAEYEGLRKLAAELGCGVVGFDKFYMFPGHDGVPASVLTDALEELAVIAGHPEVAHAPILTFGHSNATFFSAGFAAQKPDRVFAWIAFKSAYGAQFSLPAIYRIPGLVMSGENDESYFSDQLATVRKLRYQHGALMHIIIEPDGHHGLDPASYDILMAFMKTAFHLRVPADADPREGPVELIELQESEGWLGQTLDGVRVKPSRSVPRDWEQPVDTRRKLEIAPYADYPGEKGFASWLPTEEYARQWQDFCMDAAYFRKTENIGIEVLPVPGDIVIDGSIDDWDLTGGVFICGDVLHARDNASAWFHTMYDETHVYFLVRFNDSTPMNHQGRLGVNEPWQGDCVQIRMTTHPGDAEHELQIWIDAAHFPLDDQDILSIHYPRKDKPAPVKGALDAGARQAFSVYADASGYTQEIAIPWELILKDGAPRPLAGDEFRLCVEPQFTIGDTLERIQLVDIFMENEKPHRNFTWQNPQSWGSALLKNTGRRDPRPVRLADGREFSVSMDNGLPVIDWTGLTENEEHPRMSVTGAEWRHDLEGRFKQARRLEASDPPAAAAAYAALANTPYAQQAAERLADAGFIERCEARKLLQRMWVAEMSLKDARARESSLATISEAAAVLLENYPDTADATTARLMLGRLKLTIPRQQDEAGQ